MKRGQPVATIKSESNLAATVYLAGTRINDDFLGANGYHDPAVLSKIAKVAARARKALEESKPAGGG